MTMGLSIQEIVVNDHRRPIDSVILDVNTAWEKIFNMPRERAVGKKDSEVTPELDRTWYELCHEVVLSGEPVHLEQRLRKPDGIFEVTVFCPEPGRFAVIRKDISARKKAELPVESRLKETRARNEELHVIEDKLSGQNAEIQEAYARLQNTEATLHESDHRFRLAAKAADMVVFTMDRDLRYTWIYNPHHEFLPEQVLGKRDDELLEPVSAATMMEVKRRVVDTGRPAREEIQINFGFEKIIYDLIVEPIFSKDRQVTGIICSTADITERKKLETMMWRANELLETMFSSIDVQIAYLDHDLNFIRVNRAYAHSNKHDAEFFVGKNHFDLFPNDDNERIFRGVLETGRPYYAYAKPFEHPEQGITYWDWSVQPVKDVDGTVGGVVLSLIDVTTREMAFIELEKKIDEIRKVNAELQTFAYVASHDLQEPLRMIASYLQLLERRYKNKLDDEAGEFIVFAVDGAKRLQGLIDSLLEYSRIETQGMPLTPAPIDKIVNTALTNLQVTIKENNPVITKSGLPESVLGDSPQLVRLFQNLISNSLKFRRRDRTEITISARRDGDQWIFAVRDNGIGIDPAYHDKIFAIFQRLHGHDYPGTGIGLSIAKRIVERHRGRIWLESESGRGTTFYFTLPAVDVIFEGATKGEKQA
jgi:PAS domain S-box-containing protein